MKARLRRRLKWTAAVLAVLAVLAAMPVLWIETQCVVSPVGGQAAPPSLLEAADRRQEINSYLTYPEWSIVFAYEDLAAITRRSSESDYDYFSAIREYWSSLCTINRLASSRGTIATDYRVMLHVIGLSFAAEMGIKGAWEKTIGRVTTWYRGRNTTPEDRFALQLADDYAAFLRQVPWYEFPFGRRLLDFWRQTSLVEGAPIRKLERRLALTLEWGSKAVYARLIAVGAAASQAPLRIRSVVEGLDASDLEADPRITLVRTLDSGATIIETDRYRTLTEIITGLALRGRSISEIAGSRRILVTVQVPDSDATRWQGATVLFAVPVRARPGWRRVALDARVAELTGLIRQIKAANVVLEHVYDY
jgi:hypothetical protein